jgi:hypothetical protein
MPSNSIAPSVKALDIYKDGSDWKVNLFASNGTTQIVSADIGTVEVNASSIVTFPLDLRKIGGDAAHELRIFGAGNITVRYGQTFNDDFPHSKLAVVDGEVLGQQVESIKEIGAGITRVRIAWG